MPKVTECLQKMQQVTEEQAFWYFMGIISPLKYAWQYWDMLSVLREEEITWIRSRGGSKTGDAVELAIFLGLMRGNGAWYSSQSGQLDEARDRFKLYTPWVTQVNQHHVVLVTGAVIYLGNYGGKMNIRGRRPRWIISDEEGEIDVNQKMKHAYDGAIGSSSIKQTIVRGKVIDLPPALKLHMGTPKLGSVLQENSQLHPTLIRDLNYCSWVDAKQYAHMPEYWRKRELDCVFTPANGAVFFPSIMSKVDMPKDYEWIHQGVDFNGMQNHNVGERLGRLGKDVYVLEEKTFKYRMDDDALQTWCNQFPTEVETGGEFNNYYAPNLTGVTKWSWVTGKEALIGDMNKGKIYIDPQVAPHLYSNLVSASWSQVGNKEVCKVNDLHYLAALLHAYHVIEWKPKGF